MKVDTITGFEAQRAAVALVREKLNIPEDTPSALIWRALVEARYYIRNGLKESS